MKKVLNVYLNKSYQVIDESEDSLENLTFNMVYKKADIELNAVREALQNFRGVDNGVGDLSGCPNNILAFIGNRGTGKTSALRSFVSMKRKAEAQKDGFKDKDGEVFYFDIFDLSAFQPSDSVLGLLIGKLFEKFKVIREELNKKQGRSNEIKAIEEDLSRRIQNFLVDVQTLNLKKEQFGDPRDSENPFFTLSRLASSTRVGENLMQLINVFLEYLNCEDVKKHYFKRDLNSFNYNFIAIVIDDLDLSIGNSFSIVEEFRKFLMLPNLIILCALRIEQITHSVEEYYLDHLKNVTQQRATRKEFISEVEEMTQYYLEKLFPSSRNIEMPPLLTRTWLRDKGCKIRLIDSHRSWFLGANGDEKKIDIESQKTPEQLILEYVSKKVGVLFIPQEDNIHPIIPKTLREFSGFMKVVEGLEPGEQGTRLFYDYFLLKYPRLLLSYRYEKVLLNFMEVTLEARNKYIINNWRELFPISAAGFDDPNEKELKKKFVKLLTREQVTLEKSHLSDVIVILSYVEKLNRSKCEVGLTFIIRTLISLNIQIELSKEKSTLIHKLIGESVLNPYNLKDQLGVESNSNISFGSINLSFKGNIINSNPFGLGIRTFLFPSEDTRWRQSPNRTQLEVDFDRVEKFSFDPYFPFIWNHNRKLFISLYFPNEKLDEEKLSFYFGKKEDWKFWYNLELLVFIDQNVEKFIRLSLKNKYVTNSLSNASFIERVALIVRALHEALKSLEYNVGSNTLDSNVERIPIFKFLLEWKRNREAFFTAEIKEFSDLCDTILMTNTPNKLSANPNSTYNKRRMSQRLIDYNNKFNEYRMNNSRRARIYESVSRFVAEYGDKLDDDSVLIGIRLANKYKAEKTDINKMALLDWALRIIPLINE
jgi:hypothetical protein